MKTGEGEQSAYERGDPAGSRIVRGPELTKTIRKIKKSIEKVFKIADYSSTKYLSMFLNNYLCPNVKKKSKIRGTDMV